MTVLVPSSSSYELTFLQLVNLVRQEAGVAGADLTTLQTGLTTEAARFKNWVNREWIRIQSSRPDWQFMKESAQFLTTANQASYTPDDAGVPDLKDWDLDTVRVAAQSNLADEQISGFVPWDTFRDMYAFGSSRLDRGRPVSHSVDPKKRLWLGLTPDAAYYVVFEYWRKPAALVNDDDVPSLPGEFHELISFRALRAYGVFVAAPEVVVRAEDQIKEIESRLISDQLPGMTTGCPLA